MLLTAAGGIHTLGVIDCLRNNYEKRKIKIICTDIIEQPLLRYKADGFYVVPKGNSKNYITVGVGRIHITVPRPFSGCG